MGFPQMITAHFRARVRLFASVLAATALMLTGLVTSPASAAGVTTVTKQLDDTQNAGFTAPDTFVTGALVRYRITATCSSNTTDCGVVTISDALAAGLDFVEVIKPAGLIPSSASYASSTRTVTIKAGNATTPMPDGGQMEFILVARVGSGFAGGTIPNTSTITNTTDPGTVNTSQTVTIKVLNPQSPTGASTSSRTRPQPSPRVKRSSSASASSARI
ncbi:MAG: isopeptide-forming domain-containing fimbrial protein [Marmoricola sp.]